MDDDTDLTNRNGVPVRSGSFRALNRRPILNCRTLTLCCRRVVLKVNTLYRLLKAFVCHQTNGRDYGTPWAQTTCQKLY